MLAGHKPEIGHELAWPLETSPVTDLGDQGHGRQRADAAEASEPLHLGTIEVTECDLFDLTIEIVTAPRRRCVPTAKRIWRPTAETSEEAL